MSEGSGSLEPPATEGHSKACCRSSQDDVWGLRSDDVGLWPLLTFRDVCREMRLWLLATGPGLLLLLGPILLRRWATPLEFPELAGRLLLLEVRASICFFMLLLPLSTGLTLVLCRRPMDGSWGSWLRYWLDEPRFSVWRLDVDPERRFSAKLFRLLLPDRFARFVVLDRIRLSVLSPPMAPPYERRCLSRSRLLVPEEPGR